jgi:hypothetical protein
MRKFLKYVTSIALAIGLMAAPVAVSASPTTTSWNHGRTVQYGATHILPPNGEAHRVSVSDVDFYSLVLVGDAETYGVDSANNNAYINTQLSAAGGTRHSVGTTLSHAIGTNANGTIWDVTVYAYTQTSHGHGEVCLVEYQVTPLGIFDGTPSVEVTPLSDPVCNPY